MESNNSKQRPMKQYLEWLEKQIDFCSEDKTMQREHWAFCKAYEKFKSLETTDESEEFTPYIEYWPNGNVHVKGQKNSVGQREGLWEWFYKNGNIYMRTSYIDGKRDGIEEIFYENGNIKWRTPYVEGEEDGIEERFDEHGNIVETILWKNGKIIEESKPELTPYIEYFDNGNVSMKGQKNSKGQWEGIWEGFYSNGNIQIRTTFKDGKENGIEEWFYENGNIERRIQYVEGKRDGIMEWFYENGNIKWRTPYVEGEEDGIEEGFYENGNMKRRAPYKDGEIDGIEEWFDEEGNIIKTTLWKNSEVIEETKH